MTQFRWKWKWDEEPKGWMISTHDKASDKFTFAGAKTREEDRSGETHIKYSLCCMRAEEYNETSRRQRRRGQPEITEARHEEEFLRNVSRTYDEDNDKQKDRVKRISVLPAWRSTERS